jgi:flagellar assembly factor FliW
MAFRTIGSMLEGKADSPFLWLQSTEQEHLAFILIDPRMLMPDYRPVVPKIELEQLGVKDPSECRTFAIVTIPQNAPEEMTINLQGPILLHEQRHIGRQVISDDDRHGVRMAVLKLMEGQAC